MSGPLNAFGLDFTGANLSRLRLKSANFAESVLEDEVVMLVGHMRDRFGGEPVCRILGLRPPAGLTVDVRHSRTVPIVQDAPQ
ncbi:hypothetical protein [Spirillospora sp. NPDC029432]|uniref:hypothetical protein n=1 Tax=Spirillospora sp. NPDC029432 TaxID=3154599 RepID=UPI0034564A0E